MTFDRSLLLIVAAIATSVPLQGCEATLAGANERGGILQHVGGLNRKAAFDKAEAHCKQFGRVARVNQYDVLDSSMTFDCVAP